MFYPTNACKFIAAEQETGLDEILVNAISLDEQLARQHALAMAETQTEPPSPPPVDDEGMTEAPQPLYITFFASLSWMQVTIAKSKHPDSFGRSKAYEGFIIFQIDAAAKCSISHLCVFSGHWCGTKTTQARQGLLMPFIKVKCKRKLNPWHPSKFAGTQECQKEASHGGPSW